MREITSKSKKNQSCVGFSSKMKMEGPKNLKKSSNNKSPSMTFLGCKRMGNPEHKSA